MLNGTAEDGIVIGLYKNGNGSIVICTQWTGKEYETFIKHPGINNGKVNSYGHYGDDHDSALRGHNHWVGELRDHPADNIIPLKPIVMKLSFNVLLRILYDHVDMGQIKVEPSQAKPHILSVEVVGSSKYTGKCKYDLAKLEASDISPRWLNIFEETKANIIDQQLENTLQTACLGV